MSSKTVTKHKTKDTERCPSFWLGHRTLRSSLCEREARNGMGFAFAAQRSTSSLVRRRACESRSEAELPLCQKADCLDVCEANLASLPKANVERTVPTIREDNILPYITFLKKYTIIFSTNHFQKLFLKNSVRGLLQLA